MSSLITHHEPHAKPLPRERLATECVCCKNSVLKQSPAILMPFVAHRIFNWQPIEIDESWGLSTIKKGIAYALCNTNFCNECEFLFLDMRFSEQELNALYDGYRNEEYTMLREHYEPGYREKNNRLVSGIDYLNKVEEFLSPLLNFPISILDWGGDTGQNTPFKNNNKFLHIYDISKKAPVLNAKIVSKEEVINFDYDLIICSHVLEHIPYPTDLIFEIKKSMNTSTILYIEVPYEALMQTNANDPNLNLKKRHWHEHINFFSEKALRKLLDVCDLEVLSTREVEATGGSNSTHILQLACHLK
jgi:hypothetical protein